MKTAYKMPKLSEYEEEKHDFVASRSIRATIDAGVVLSHALDALTGAFVVEELRSSTEAKIEVRCLWRPWVYGGEDCRDSKLGSKADPVKWSSRTKCIFRARAGVALIADPKATDPNPSIIEFTEYAFNPYMEGKEIVEALDSDSAFEGAFSACAETQWPDLLSTLGAFEATLLVINSRIRVGGASLRVLRRDLSALRSALACESLDTGRIGAVMMDVMEPDHIEAVLKLGGYDQPIDKNAAGAARYLNAAARRHDALQRVLRRSVRDLHLLDAETDYEKFLLAVAYGRHEGAVLETLACCAPDGLRVPVIPLDVTNAALRRQMGIANVQIAPGKNPDGQKLN